MDAVLACLVRRCRHYGSLRGVAGAADNDRPANQFWTAEYFDGRDELVEVDMQDPGRR